MYKIFEYSKLKEELFPENTINTRQWSTHHIQERYWLNNTILKDEFHNIFQILVSQTPYLSE